MGPFFASTLCSASVCRFLQNSDDGWQPVYTWVEPTLALKLYVLFVLISCVVAAVRLLRNWFLVPPFRRVPTDSAQRAVPAFRSQARSLRRWMILNALAWAAATVAGLISLFRGMGSSRPVQIQLFALGLEEVLRLAGLFFLTLIVLYVVRWHILWRAERLERHQ